MTPERWAYLKALQPPAPRMFWPASRGTYNVGRNAEKRAKKARALELSRVWRRP